MCVLTDKMKLFTFTILLKLISTIKLGFIIKDDDNIFIEKFVAFGSIPDTTNEADKLVISNDLNRFYRQCQNEMQRTQSNLVQNPLTFTASLFHQADLPEDNVQVTLEGGLSTFSALFRFKLMNCVKSHSIWKSVIFYSDPVIKMKKVAFLRESLKENLYLVLEKVAFDNLDTTRNKHLLKFDYSRIKTEPSRRLNNINIEFDEEGDDEDGNRYTVLEFLPSSDVNPNQILPKKKCSCCTIS